MKLKQLHYRQLNQYYPDSSSSTSNNSSSISAQPLLIIFGILIALGMLVALCKPKHTNICCMNILQCLYKWCFFRLDCTSTLSTNEAIMRYIEEPPLDPEDFTNQVTSNTYIKWIVNSFARQLPEYFLSILPSGSLREGLGKLLPSTSVLASDFDIMLIPEAVLVGHASKTYDGDESPLFATVESKEIEEGFLWLRLENEYISQWKDLCIRRQTTGKGYSYLSSFKVHDLLSNAFSSKACLTVVANTTNMSRADLDVEVEQSGPALTIKVKGKGTKSCGMTYCKSLWKLCENDQDETLFYCDLTFSLHCPEWPASSNWFSPERRKEWPSQRTVTKILGIGCHVVPKPSTNSLVTLHQDQPTNTTFSQSPGLEWRYSFSQPEILVIKEIPEKAKSAYLALKAVNKRYFSIGFYKAPLNYQIKCVLLQLMEETKSQFWMHEHDAIEVFNKMLDILHQHLSNRVFPHYWIPSINLIKDLDIPTLDLLCQKINIVRSKPQAYVADNWLEITRCLRLNCCSCCAFGRGAPPYNAMSRRMLVQESICPFCFIPCAYSDSTSCLGPCPYDKMNMDVY